MHPALRAREPLRATLGTAWRAAVVGLPWYVFSWFYFGSAIPDTLVIKQSQGWGDFVRGLWDRYHRLYPEATLAVVIVAALGLLALLATPSSRWADIRPVALSVATAASPASPTSRILLAARRPAVLLVLRHPVCALTLVLAFAIAAAATGRSRPSDSRCPGPLGAAAGRGAL